MKYLKKNKNKIYGALIGSIVLTVIWFAGGKEYYNYIMSTSAGSEAGDFVTDENGNKIKVDDPRDASKFKEPESCKEYIPWGTHVLADKVVKDRSLWLCKSSFAMQYDPIIKFPIWTAEIIKKRNLIPFNIPSSFNLMEDPTIPSVMQPQVATFKNLPNGYKVGLLAPILNRYLNADALTTDKLNELNYKSIQESFYTTNSYVVADNAKVIIDKIDQDIRTFVQEKNELYVISGLVFLNGEHLGVVKKDNQDLLIPTHIYKVITYPNTYASISYIIPNTNNLACGTQCNPDMFKVTMQEVERVTGLEFYTKLAPYYAVQVKKDLNQIFKNLVQEKR